MAAKKPVKKQVKKTAPASPPVAVAETAPLPPVEPEGNHNGNNHEPTDEQRKALAPILNDDNFQKAFTTQRTSNAIDKLVERGEDERDFLLRGSFKDANHANSCAILLMLASHYEDKELRELVFNHMAAYPAIGEGRIQDLVKAIIGDMESRKKLNPFGVSQLWQNITGNGSKNGENKPG